PGSKLGVSGAVTIGSTYSDLAGPSNGLAIEGNVGIGTTGPSYTLDVKSSGTNIARFNGSNSTGCTLSDGGIIACSSDINLKKNITDLEYGLDSLMSLHPVSFNWKSENDDSSKSLGFIAQEVEQVIPKLVSTDTNGYKELNTIGLVPVLVKGLQEQRQDILGIKAILDTQSSAYESVLSLGNTNTNDISAIPSESATFATSDQTTAAISRVQESVKSNEAKILELNLRLESINSTLKTLEELKLSQNLPESSISSTKEDSSKANPENETLSSQEKETDSLQSEIDVLKTTLSLLTPDESTESAAFALDNYTDSPTEFLNGIKVAGKSFISDTNIAGKLTVGLLTLNDEDTSINSLTEPLKLQNESPADIEIFKGEIRLSKGGALKAVKVEAKEVTTEALTIKAGDSATIGSAKLKAGESKVDIESQAVKESSKIFLTPTKETDKILFILDKEEGKKFSVGVKSSLDEDITFDWWIINSQ
ncbi:tail fiber domain-containing protein, partial [candidate division WWE3 bacterium]|nr:tail fiber domain-containing protein [candidate division WWE3 bacterium]